MLQDLIRTNVKAVDKRDPVSSVDGYLRGASSIVPIVCDNGRPYGVLNERALQSRARLDEHQHIERYVVGARLLTPEMPMEEALSILAEARLPYGPVVEGKKLLGYVRAIDLLRILQPGLTAERVAVQVPTVKPSTTVGEALHLLERAAAGILPVMNGSGRLDGVVTRQLLHPLATDARADGRKAALGEVLDPRASTLEGYVDGRFETVRPDAPLDEVLEVLDGFGFAVVQDRAGAVRGVVTPETAAHAARNLRPAER